MFRNLNPTQFKMGETALRHTINQQEHGNLEPRTPEAWGHDSCGTCEGRPGIGELPGNHPSVVR